MSYQNKNRGKPSHSQVIQRCVSNQKGIHSIGRTSIATMPQKKALPWVKPIQNRFTFTSYRGPFKIFSDIGELISPQHTMFVFGDGILHFTDDNQSITVHAEEQSKAVFLLEVRDKIIAAIALSDDKGALVKHLDEKAGRIPIRYKDTAVVILVLPDHAPFSGFISVVPMQTGQTVRCGSVHIKDLDAPRMFVPEALTVMYQHLRNQEMAGIRSINKHTFAEYDLPKQGPQKEVDQLCRLFSANEAMRWLEKSKNHTQIEAALQREFVFGHKERCLIYYPKQMKDYVSVWCKTLNFLERPQCTKSDFEEMSSSENEVDTDQTNSQEEDDEDGAASMAMQQARAGGPKQTKSKLSKQKLANQSEPNECSSIDTHKGDDSKELQLFQGPEQMVSSSVPLDTSERVHSTALQVFRGSEQTVSSIKTLSLHDLLVQSSERTLLAATTSSKGDDSKTVQVKRGPGSSVFSGTKPSFDELKDAVCMVLQDLWLRRPKSEWSKSEQQQDDQK